VQSRSEIPQPYLRPLNNNSKKGATASSLANRANERFLDTYLRVILGEDGEGQQMVVDMQLIDTAGEDDTRGAAHYPSADVFLVCFSIISPSSFESITSRVRSNNKAELNHIHAFSHLRHV